MYKGIRLIFIGLVLSAPLQTGKCWAKTITKKHIEVIETNHKEYQIKMGGYQDDGNSRGPMGYEPFSVIFEPNKSVEIENIGNTVIKNPRLIINGERDWGNIDNIAASIITDSMTIDERVRAIFEFCKTHLFHFSPDRRDGLDPVKAFNVYGYATCRETVNILGALLYKIGLDVYKIRLPEHLVNSVYYDNTYHLLDADRKVYYLNTDNKTIAGADDLLDDHYLMKRTHIYGITSSDDKIKSELEASIYRGITATTRYSLNSILKDVDFYKLNYSLRPGEKIIFNWHNTGKYHGPQQPTPQVWNLLCNGKLVYKPNISLDRAKSDGLVYELKSPYVIVGGNIEGKLDKKNESDSCNFYFSYNKQTWKKIAFAQPGEGSYFNLNIDNFFLPNLSPAKYKYYIKIELSAADTGIKELTFNTDVQMAYLSLPALKSGVNNIVYKDETTGPHKLKITRTWDENYTNHPPQPPETPVYPADNSKVSNTPFEFSWPAALDEDGDKISDYRFQLSNYADMRWPLSANFDKLISHTVNQGKSAYKIPLSGLLNSGEKYYWRVKAQDEAGLWSDWSKTWSFVPTGVMVPENLRLEKTANMLTLVWDTSFSKESAGFFELYGSDEKGFTPSKTEYDVVSSTYFDNEQGIKHRLKKFPPNFITTVKENRYKIFDSDKQQRIKPYAYYRVVAVGANGSISGPSAIIEIYRPFIYSKPTYKLAVNMPYEYQLKSVCSIGDLQSRPVKQATAGGLLVNRYLASFYGGDNLKFSLLLAPGWLKIKQTDAGTALIYGKPQTYNGRGTSRVIALVTDDFMNFDIQVFKVQGSYGGDYLKFIKNLLGFSYKYLQTKFSLKIRGPILRLKRIYWNIHNKMPLGY